MVKPGERSSIMSHPPPSNSGTTDSGDFSFVVLSNTPSLNNVAPTNGSLLTQNMSSTGQLQSSNNISLLATEEAILLSSLPGMTPEEVQKKLHDVLRENLELKDTLQQNNLAMKQQFNTLIAWQEDVTKVHQNHKEKFEETRIYINKLKAEIENLRMKKEVNPNIEKIQAENSEMKAKVETLKNAVADQEKMIKEKEALRNEIIALEQKLARAIESQQQSERTVEELTQYQTKLVMENEELNIRANLLQTELQSAQSENFVLVEQANIDVPRPQLVAKSWTQGDVTKFLNLLDSYDERVNDSYKKLDQLMDQYVSIQAWLSGVVIELPNNNVSIEIDLLQSVLEDIRGKINLSKSETERHRLRLEEASHQLGKLASDFQGLLQEWLKLDKKNIVTMVEVPKINNDSEELKAKIESLTLQLAESLEKVRELETAAQNTSKLGAIPKKTDVTKELKHQIDMLTAEQLETQDKLENMQKLLTAKENSLAKANEQLETQKTQLKEMNETLQDSLKKQKTFEANVDALQAQAEVYKMDFNEERESREKLATEKEQVADDLRAQMKRNQDLVNEIEALRIQIEQNQGQSQMQATGGTRQNFNTIATPGRSARHEVRISEPERRSASPPLYECPKCQLRFNSFDPLERHVNLCLDSDMYPY